MMTRLLSILLTFHALGAPLLALPAAGPDEHGFAVEVATGTALSVPLPLTIDQDGFAELRARAHYATRPFEGSPYYAWRVGLWRRGGAWELEVVHHKLYLENPPPEVERFQVTHGYDLITLGRAWHRGSFLVRVGAGIVLAHPEGTIRGRTWPERGGIAAGFLGLLGHGYFLTGPSARASISRRFGRTFFVAPELELTAARARVPIVEGEASVPNIALHPRLAVGFRF